MEREQRKSQEMSTSTAEVLQLDKVSAYWQTQALILAQTGWKLTISP